MERFEALKRRVYDFLLAERPDQVCAAMSHLGYSAALAGLLGMRAGLNVELCQTAAYLHDVWLYLHAPLDAEGLKRHAAEGAKLAEQFLDESYSPEEKEIVIRMIFNHDFNEQVDDAYSEVMKDADMLSHHINLCRFDTGEDTHPRVKPLGEALGFAVGG